MHQSSQGIAGRGAFAQEAARGSAHRRGSRLDDDGLLLLASAAAAAADEHEDGQQREADAHRNHDHAAGEATSARATPVEEAAIVDIDAALRTAGMRRMQGEGM